MIFSLLFALSLTLVTNCQHEGKLKPTTRPSSKQPPSRQLRGKSSRLKKSDKPKDSKKPGKPDRPTTRLPPKEVLRQIAETAPFPEKAQLYKDIATQFYARGGTIIAAVELENTNLRLKLNPEDYFYPICHEGQNRSQVLRIILKEQLATATEFDDLVFDSKYISCPNRICAPHGAEKDSAFLAGNGEHEELEYEGKKYILDIGNYSSVPVHPKGGTKALGDKTLQAFENVMGEEKFSRLGFINEERSPGLEKVSVEKQTESQLLIHTWFNQHFYKKILKAKKYKHRIFAFQRAPVHIMKRLLDNAAPEDNFEHIIIYSLPWGDQINEYVEGTPDLSEKYKHNYLKMKAEFQKALFDS